MGCNDQFLPDNPADLTKLITDYLIEDLTKVYMIHNEGNEWQHPEAEPLIEQLKTNLQKMFRERSEYVEQWELTTAFLESLVGTVFVTQLEPGLKSMLSDINQMNESLRSSRTDDLNTVLTIGR